MSLRYTLGDELRRLAATTADVFVAGISDAGFLPLTETHITVSQNQIIKHDGTLLTVEQGGSPVSISKGMDIEIYGVHNNAMGTVLYTNATVSKGFERTITHQIIGNYASRAGDSGAPIITVENNVNKLIGMHQGATCFFDEVLPDRIDRITNQTSCEPNDNDIDHFKIFGTWENVKDVLQLR